VGINSNSLVYTNVPPMPNTKVLATAIPTVALANNRATAPFVSDMQGMISFTHNSTAVSPTFTLYTWSDVTGYWILGSNQACAQFAMITWLVYTNTPFFILASTSLIGGGAIAVLGGVTIQGNAPILASGE
jgi:hypothetical protein